MKRREFTSFVGIGIGAGVLPLAVTGCQSKTAQSPASSTGAASSGSFETVGTVAELQQGGQLLNEQLAIGKVLVISDPADPAQVVAVNPTCPHASCTVEWQPDDGVFVCPCHDSRFTPDGQVQQGPATEPLATYAAKVDGSNILVSSS